MNYKALEDLINILVRKCGIDLKDEVFNYRKNVLESKLKELKSSSNVFMYEKDINIIEKSLEMWDSKIVLYANEILKSYEEKKPYYLIKDRVEFLVNKSKEELDRTNKELEESNIFEVLDKYNKELKKLEESLVINDYKDRENLGFNNFANAYRNSKIKSLKRRRETLESQISSLNKLIKVLNDEYDKVNLNKALLEEKLLICKEKTYSNELKISNVEEVDKLEEIISQIEKEIEMMQLLGDKYLKEISKYKNEEINKKEEMFLNEKEIVEEKEIILDIKDNVKYLSDQIKYYSTESRVKSISLEQQYLYVNSDVIKEEIELLWKKSGINFVEEIEYFEA